MMGKEIDIFYKKCEEMMFKAQTMSFQFVSELNSRGFSIAETSMVAAFIAANCIMNESVSTGSTVQEGREFFLTTLDVILKSMESRSKEIRL